MFPEIKAIMLAGPMLFPGVSVDHITSKAEEFGPIAMEAKMKDVDKIAEALLFETRGQCDKDKWAIAEVILNRTKLDGFPNDVTKVVEQHVWKNGKKLCQFSYRCEPNLKNKRAIIRQDYAEWKKIRRVAFNSVVFGPTNYTNGADHYYNPKKASPDWYTPRKVTLNTCVHRFMKLSKW